MAALIGREAWHTASGVLLHGTIIEEKSEPIATATLLLFNGERKVVTASNLLLTIQDAIAECDSYREYWQYEMKQLESAIPIHSTK